MEVAHAITYNGMPYFFMESSPYQATWFYMVSRFILAVGVIVIVFMKEKQVSLQRRNLTYGLAICFIWVAFYHLCSCTVVARFSNRRCGNDFFEKWVAVRSSLYPGINYYNNFY
ncbi:hypothetical protein BTR23_14925 [Alkalihalophilus pseudofirmus]|nr:hypothetical protein BTR23_14925 [Alkalihalophilus pseudofirmus]